jgi:hypothetical protein
MVLIPHPMLNLLHMDVPMIRTTLFSLLAIGFTSPLFAQSSLDEFEFPEFDDAPKQTSVDAPAKNQKLITTDSQQASPNAPVPLPLPDANAQQQTSPTVQAEVVDSGLDPVGNGANLYSGMAPPQSYQPFVGYMSYGPSPVTPMLGYMMCSQNACPDVWAGFAAEHAREMAHHCSKHGCHGHGHGCGCGACGSSLYAQPSLVPPAAHHHLLHHRHNRYTQAAAAPACDTCGSR